MAVLLVRPLTFAQSMLLCVCDLVLAVCWPPSQVLDFRAFL